MKKLFITLQKHFARVFPNTSEARKEHIERITIDKIESSTRVIINNR